MPRRRKRADSDDEDYVPTGDDDSEGDMDISDEDVDDVEEEIDAAESEEDSDSPPPAEAYGYDDADDDGIAFTTTSSSAPKASSPIRKGTKKRGKKRRKLSSPKEQAAFADSDSEGTVQWTDVELRSFRLSVLKSIPRRFFMTPVGYGLSGADLEAKLLSIFFDDDGKEKTKNTKKKKGRRRKRGVSTTLSGRAELAHYLGGVRVSRLRRVLSKHAPASVLSAVRGCAKDEIISLLVEKVFGDAGTKWATQSRAEESAVLEQTDVTQLFCRICDVLVPRDVMGMIFSYCVRNLSFFLSAALVDSSWFAMVLSTWDKVVIREQRKKGRAQVALKNISVLVLRSITELDVQRMLTVAEWKYLFDTIDRRRLRVLHVGIRNVVRGLRSFFGAMAKLAAETTRSRKVTPWAKLQRGVKLVGLRELRIHPNVYQTTTEIFRRHSSVRKISRNQCFDLGKKVMLKDVTPNLEAALFLPSFLMCKGLTRLRRVAGLHGMFYGSIHSFSLPSFDPSDGRSMQMLSVKALPTGLTALDLYASPRGSDELPKLLKQLVPKFAEGGLRELQLSFSGGVYYSGGPYYSGSSGFDLSSLPAAYLRNLTSLTLVGNFHKWSVLRHCKKLTSLHLGGVSQGQLVDKQFLAVLQSLAATLLRFSFRGAKSEMYGASIIGRNCSNLSFVPIFEGVPFSSWKFVCGVDVRVWKDHAECRISSTRMKAALKLKMRSNTIEPFLKFKSMQSVVIRFLKTPKAKSVREGIFKLPTEHGFDVERVVGDPLVRRYLRDVAGDSS